VCFLICNVLKLGIYLQVAALKVFIASQRIPSDMKFFELEMAYKSEDGLQMFLFLIRIFNFVSLKKDSIVRFRIIGVTVKGNEMFAIATIADDYLGVIKRS